MSRSLARFIASLAAFLLFETQAAPLTVADAARAIAERQSICDTDAGRLWKHDLCGPILFVDPKTRRVVADRNTTSGALTRQGDLYEGQIPDSQTIANTATDWDGVHWTMVMWPLPEDAVERRALLTHESFHRIQEEIGLPKRSPIVASLATEEARGYMRLEWRALSAALSAKDREASRAAAIDALRFRQARRALSPEAAKQENELEMNEGLAQYTGVVLAAKSAAPRLAAAALAKAEASDSYVRNFAYASGPAYGLLLDRFAPNWRRRLSDDSDLGNLLKESLSTRLEVSTTAVESRYGGKAIRSQEAEAAHKRAATTERWTKLLVDGPVLRIAFAHMSIQFNPNDLFALKDRGTVYGTLRISDDWGVLEVGGGALIGDGWSSVQVSAPSAPEITTTPTWTLHLKPGWQIRPGERPGDMILDKIASPVQR
ncbi:hypothetical protein ACS5PN_27285 [Roseateles sp. NT4]|uniref:hypothetical protein n=1 Tax=Roseateles sp. NT4 TaxID=3453715 RepID=UPI003EEFD5DD